MIFENKGVSMNIFKWAIDRFFFMDSYHNKYLKVFFTPPEDDSNDLNFYLEKLRGIRDSFVYCHRDDDEKLVAIFEVKENEDTKKEAEDICQKISSAMDININRWEEILME